MQGEIPNTLNTAQEKFIIRIIADNIEQLWDILQTKIDDTKEALEELIIDINNTCTIPLADMKKLCDEMEQEFVVEKGENGVLLLTQVIRHLSELCAGSESIVSTLQLHRLGVSRDLIYYPDFRIFC